MALTSFSYKNEGYAFPRKMFPFEINGHTLRVAENKLFVDDDDRLRVHLILYCSDCHEKHAVRTRFPYGYEGRAEAAAFCKLILLAKFSSHHQKI